LEVDAKVVKALGDERQRRAENRGLVAEMKANDPALAKDPVLAVDAHAGRYRQGNQQRLLVDSGLVARLGASALLSVR
jgi:hypothetical protein